MKLFIIALSTFVLFAGCYGGAERGESVDFGPAPADDSSPPTFDAPPSSDPDDGALDPGSMTDAVPLPADGIPVDAGMMVPPDDGPLENVTVNLAWWDRTVSTADFPLPAVTAVKKQIGFMSVQVQFRAPTDSGVHFTEVNLEGRGNVSRTWRAEHLRDVVYECGLYDGATQLGRNSAPDESGVIRIPDARFDLDASETRILTMRCSADSVVALPEGDRFAIGLGFNVPTFTAFDDAGRPRYPQFGRGLINQVDPAVEPFLPVTVQNSGTLVVTMDYEHLRPAGILLHDRGDWQQMVTYNAEATLEDGTIEFVRIRSQGDAASFTEVGIAQEGYVRGTCILPAGRDQACNVRLTAPITVPVGERITFYLWSRLASVVSGASVAGATEGVARSGATIALGLSDSVETGEWDSSYLGMLNVRVTGSISGERLRSPRTTAFGNTFVVRMSRPTVTRQDLATTTIVNGHQQDLYIYGVAVAPLAASISLHNTFMIVNVASAAGRICNVRLRRGATELRFDGMGSDEYQIRGIHGHIHPDQCWDNTWGPLIVNFLGDELVTGVPGNLYTLFGTPEGFVSGDSITITFETRDDDGVVTGYLHNESGYEINLDESPWGTYGMPPFRSADFIWSDLSEVPHNAAMGGGGGSRDWTNGYLIEDLTQAQVLTAL